MGPGCLTAVFGMGTGGAIRVCSPRKLLRISTRQRGEGEAASIAFCTCVKGMGNEQRINAVKRLAVSTGRLRPLLTLHFRPIDLVVFQEPMHLAVRET